MARPKLKPGEASVTLRIRVPWSLYRALMGMVDAKNPFAQVARDVWKRGLKAYGITAE